MPACASKRDVLELATLWLLSFRQGDICGKIRQVIFQELPFILMKFFFIILDQDF